jgi:uncharacterized membrane protein YqjE
MPLAMKPNSDGKIAALLTNIADGLGHLITEHIALAKIEITGDATALARSLVQAAAFLALVLIGYGFLSAALVTFLAPERMSYSAALLIVGGGNLIVGAIGAYRGLRKMSARPMMRESIRELDRSAAALSAGIGSNGLEVTHDQRF